jgi:hypothetical protein
MNAHRAYFRRLAIQRRRPVDQDAKNEAAALAVRERVTAALATYPLLQRLSAAATAPGQQPPDWVP